MGNKKPEGQSGNSGDPPEIQPDDPRLAQLSGPPAAALIPGQRQVAGIRLAPRALQDAVNVLKTQPWEQVADFMPQLITAQPIFADELVKPPE